MSSVGAVLTGISIVCIAAGVALLVVQVRRKPTDPEPTLSGNGSEPPRRAASRPASPTEGPTAHGRSEATRRRQVLSALLVAMVASLGAALVVQERWVFGIHLFLDDAFLGYVAWLARRAETRGRAAAPPPEPSSDRELLPAPESLEPPEAEETEEAEEAEITDARA